MGNERLTALHTEMRSCRRCLDTGYPIVPNAVFSGPATATIMIVGQAPGVTESQVARPFNGSSGRRLFQWLASAGWKEDLFRATQYLTAVTKCFPGKGSGGKGDRVPTRAEQKMCAPFLEQEIRLVRPEIVVPVGGLAVQRFLGRLKLADVVGKVYQRDQGWIVPLPHPSGASLWLNQPENQERVWRALEHIKQLSRDLELLP